VNHDPATVASFGEEWNAFDQSKLAGEEFCQRFEDYFCIFPWSALPDKTIGFDLGCGTGGWAKDVIERVGHLYLIDPSVALAVVRRNLDQSMDSPTIATSDNS